MYCQKCGKEIMDEAVVCPGCGCATAPMRYAAPAVQSQPQEETATLATLSIVFAILIPAVGFIMSIIGLCKYKNKTFKNRSLLALFLSVFVWIVCFWLMINWYAIF